MQRQALEITQPEKLRAANHSGAIKHLHQPVINSQDQQHHRENDLDQDHFSEPRFDIDFWFAQFHGCLFQRLHVLDNFLDLLIAKVRLGHFLLEFPCDDFRFGMKDFFANKSVIHRDA